LYVDKSGVHYSPNQYILKFVEASASNKSALMKIMKDCGLVSRYYRDIEPGSGGRQPDNYHGLPPRLKILWEERERGVVKAEDV